MILCQSIRRALECGILSAFDVDFYEVRYKHLPRCLVDGSFAVSRFRSHKGLDNTNVQLGILSDVLTQCNGCGRIALE